MNETEDDALYATANGSFFLTQQDGVSLATLTIWAYLVPHMYVELAEYSLAVGRSRIWSQPERIGDVRNAMKVTFITNIILGVILYFGVSLTVSLLTENMDRRMTSIVVGTSQLFAGIVFFILSVNMPQWFGFYFTTKRHVATFHSLKEIKFNFSWSLWKQMSAMFFYNMFFSCHTLHLATLKGVLVGVFIGALFIYMVYMVRSKCKRCTRAFAIITIIALVLVSYYCGVIGILYIGDVWLNGDGSTTTTTPTTGADDQYLDDDFYYDLTPDTGDTVALSLMILVFIGWPIVIIICHICCRQYTERKMKKNATHRFNSQIFRQSLTPAALLTMLKALRQPKEELPSETSGNTNVLPIMSTPSKLLETASEWEGVEGGNNCSAIEEQSPVICDGDEKEDKDPAQEHKGTSVISAEGSSSILFMTQCKENTESMAENISSRALDESNLDAHDEDGNNRDDDEYGWDDGDGGILNDAEAPSYCLLFCAKLYETYPNLFCCFKKALLRHVPEPRLSLYGTVEKMSYPQKCWNAVVRLFWYLSSFLFFFLTIVNIGSTTQQDDVRAALGPTFAQLYPLDYNNGTMCAWNEASPNGTIKTFDTLQSVYDANWTVIHCGACGACSNWNDLRLQWTTRKELAKLSKKCAQKSMSGSWDDVQTCNEDTIGFLPDCAECWTYDEINTKKECYWIFLQSIFIDAVADFSVGFNDITSATCDEALSGQVFVPCSGATRRRMGIKSDIPRPDYQQCKVAKHNWTSVFNHP